MAHTFSQSGWCNNCGRRRGSDGRCSNCDPWWTSPLVSVGGPMLALAALGLMVIVRVVGPRPSGSGASFYANPNAPRPVSSPTTSFAYADPGSGQPRGIVFPSVAGSLPAADPSAAWRSRRSRNDDLLADLERLRGMVWEADAAARRRLGGTEFANPSHQPRSGTVAAGT